MENLLLNILFIVLFFGYILFIRLFLKVGKINFSEICVSNFSVFALFVFSYLGTFPLFFGLDEYRFNTGIKDKFLIFQVFLFSAYTILSVTIGIYFGKKIFKKKRLIIFELRKLNKNEIFFIAIISLFSMIIFFHYLMQIPKLAIFVAIYDGISEAKITRSIMGNDFSGKYHWYKFVMVDLFRILTFIFFSNWLISRNKKSFLLFISLLTVSIFSSIMATEKAPLIWLLIGLLFSYVLTKRNGKLPFKSIAYFGVLILSVLSLFYIYFMGATDLFSALGGTFSRAFTGGIAPAYHYIEYFPNYHDFLLGRSFPNPGGIFPFEPYRLTVEIMNWKNPELSTLGIVGSMPTVFWGELYANFSYFGVFIIPFFVGIFLYVIDYLVSCIENSPLKVGLITWLIIHYQGISEGGISSYIIDIYLVLVIITILAVISFSNNFKIKYFK